MAPSTACEACFQIKLNLQFSKSHGLWLLFQSALKYIRIVNNTKYFTKTIKHILQCWLRQIIVSLQENHNELSPRIFMFSSVFLSTKKNLSESTQNWYLHVSHQKRQKIDDIVRKMLALRPFSTSLNPHKSIRNPPNRNNKNSTIYNYDSIRWNSIEDSDCVFFTWKWPKSPPDHRWELRLLPTNVQTTKRTTHNLIWHQKIHSPAVIVHIRDHRLQRMWLEKH